MSIFGWVHTAHVRKRATSCSSEADAMVAASTQHSDIKTEYKQLEPSAIADAVEFMYAENERAHELCAKADLVIKGQEYELSRLRETNKAIASRNDYLEASNRQVKSYFKNAEAALARTKTSLTESTCQLAQHRHLLKAEQGECQALQDEIQEARLKIRILQCSDLYDDQASSTDMVRRLVKNSNLLPTPFVVILIDGDSYLFSREHSQAIDAQGRDIAHRLNRELSKYILSHPQIPPQSKIIARVFCNRSSLQGKITRTPGANAKGKNPPPKREIVRQPSERLEAMLKFAETYPLFDFLDCGGGKERVDDKIRENCHLYMGDSNCHALFLAVCNDNGYVRMLERYNGITNKIVLLTNGMATEEMEKLSFPKVELNKVFSVHYQRKRRQGSSGKMGPLKLSCALTGHENASDYDLNYMQPTVQKRIDNVLQEMRQQKQAREAKATMFARLPYETNGRYEERMQALLPFSQPRLSHRHGFSRSVGFVGLRKVRPAGLTQTAPVLPFMLYSEVVQDTHGKVSEVEDVHELD